MASKNKKIAKVAADSIHYVTSFYHTPAAISMAHAFVGEFVQKMTEIDPTFDATEFKMNCGLDAENIKHKRASSR